MVNRSVQSFPPAVSAAKKHCLPMPAATAGHPKPPAVYRPCPSRETMQAKMQPKPAGPAIYQPCPAKEVIQAKRLTHQVPARSVLTSTSGTQHSSLPISRIAPEPYKPLISRPQPSALRPIAYTPVQPKLNGVAFQVQPLKPVTQAKAVAPTTMERRFSIHQQGTIPIRSVQPASTGSIQMAKKVSYFSSPYAHWARTKRHTSVVGGRNIATVEYQLKTKSGWSVKKYKSETSAGFHSEKLLYDFLEGLGVKYRVNWLYTELAPCGSDCHNCDERVKTWFPNLDSDDIYYSIDYPSYEDVSTDDSSDSDSTKEKRKRQKAKRRRKRGPRTLKRFETRIKKEGPDSDDDVDESSFKPALTTIYSPTHYSSGIGF